MSPRLSSIDQFSASDSLVVYPRNGGVSQGTVGLLMDYVQSTVQVGDAAIYERLQPENEQKDSTYIYFAWARIDGAGYLAERRDLSTGQAAGSATGSLPIPSDLTPLPYTT